MNDSEMSSGPKFKKRVYIKDLVWDPYYSFGMTLIIILRQV